MTEVTVTFKPSEMFSRVKKRSYLADSSLWFVMENCTNEKCRIQFGTGLSQEDRAKYSKSIVIKSLITGNYYSLYKATGEWRCGASSARSEYDKKLLIHLLGKE